MKVIESKSISKSFKSKGALTTVFSNIDFAVESGKFTSIQGMSGVGKSTLLHILGTIDKPDTGEVWLNTGEKSILLSDQSDKELSRIRNKHIGFIFQFHHLLPEFSAIENVMMPALISGETFKNASDKAMQLLETVGIADRKNNKPQEMSGGEQQRAAIARALINTPTIVLADEPTGNLDEKNSEAVLDLLNRLKDEFQQTFLVATHSKEVALIADVKLMMKSGHIEDIS